MASQMALERRLAFVASDGVRRTPNWYSRRALRRAHGNLAGNPGLTAVNHFSQGSTTYDSGWVDRSLDMELLPTLSAHVDRPRTAVANAAARSRLHAGTDRPIAYTHPKEVRILSALDS